MDGLFYDEHCEVSGARLARPGQGASMTLGEAEAYARGKSEAAAEIERLRAQCEADAKLAAEMTARANREWAEAERLRAEAKDWRGELHRLDAENDRLRAALREIVACHGPSCDASGIERAIMEELAPKSLRIARAALAGRDEATGLEYRGG